MKCFFSILLIYSTLVLSSNVCAVDTAGVKLRLLEMTAEQAIELNLEMDAERVGRKENGEPIFQQLISQSFEKKLAQYKDVIVVSAPQVQVQLSRRGEIKIGKELRYPKNQDPANGRITTDGKFVGYEILVVPFAGKGDIAIDVALRVSYRELISNGELTKDGVILPGFFETKLESRMIVTSGKTVYFGELAMKDGKKVMVVGKVVR